MPTPGVVSFDPVQATHDLSDSDLSNTLYSKNSMDRWESWPEKLYTPADLAGEAIVEPPVSLALDASRTIQYATHRLRIQLPPGKTYGLLMNTCDYAMRLFIDGVEVDCVGIPGSSRETTVPRKKDNAVYYFAPRSDTVEIIVYAANFVHREGAYPPSLHIGTAENITRKAEKDLFTASVILGIR